MLRRNLDFQLLFAGQAAAIVAGGAAMFALPLYVFAATGSAAQAGLIGSVSLAAYVVMLLPAGTLADWLPTRPVLLGGETMRALAAAGLMLIVLSGRPSLVLLMVCAVLDTVAGALSRAAGQAAVKRLVPADDLTTALAWMQGRNAAAGVAGPPLGGLLLLVHPALPYAMKALAHLLAVLTVAAIKAQLPSAAQRSSSRTTALAAGLAFLWRDRFLRAAMLTAAGVNFAFGGVQSTVTLGGVRAGVAPLSLGLVVGLAAVGGLAGSALSPWLSTLLTARRAFLLVLGGGAITVALMAVAPGTVVLGGLFAAAMLLPPVISVVVGTQRIARTPEDLQGRVATASSLIAVAATPLGPLLAGVVVQRVGGAMAYLMFGCLLAAMTAAAFRLPLSIEEKRHELEPAGH